MKIRRKKMLGPFRIAMFFSSLILFSSCTRHLTEESRIKRDGKSEVNITQPLPDEQTEGNSARNKGNSEELKPEDVSIEVKIPSVSGIEKKVLPAEFLEDESDKPGKLHPQCIAINFLGEYAKGYSENEAWFPAQIMICPVEEYPKVLEKSDHLVQYFKTNISSLKSILLDKPPRIDKRFAIIDFIDAEPAFFVNLNYVTFKSGEGFFVMTEFVDEPTVIVDSELKYIFQGFTGDGKYYVLGTFPVRSNHLSDKAEVEDDSIMKGKEYDEYIAKIKKLLMDKSSFSPTLEQIEETIKSLEIKQSINPVS
jgi:hypothetical protein